MRCVSLILCLLVVHSLLPGVDRHTDAHLIQAIAKRQACLAFIGSASGVVVDPSGLILTNYHVVFDEKKRVLIRDWRVRIAKRLVPAEVIGSPSLTWPCSNAKLRSFCRAPFRTNPA